MNENRDPIALLEESLRATQEQERTRRAQRMFLGVVFWAAWIGSVAIAGWLMRTFNLYGGWANLIMWPAILGLPLAWEKWGPEGS